MTENRPDIPRLLEKGIAAHRTGDFALAEQLYRQIMAADVAHFQARYMLGLVFLQRNQFELAQSTIAEALRLAPGEAGAYSNRALALFHLGRFAEAVTTSEQGLALNPGLVLAHVTRGRSLLALHQARQAIASFDQALRLNPQQPDVWHARAGAHLSLGQADEALADFDRVLVLNPQHVEALSLRGYVLESQRRYEEAIASYDRAFALRPDEPFLEGARLHARMHICDWQDFDVAPARLLSHVDQGKPAAAPFALLPIASNGLQQKTSAMQFVQRRCPPTPEGLWRGQHYGHDKIRIAYLSASLVRHPVAILAADIFESHDRSQFEISAISLAPDDGSDIRARLKSAFDRFIDAEEKSDVEIAHWLRQNETDIVVDLDGYTTNGRTEILAHRPAPVQVNYLGYPSTLGAAYIDYIIADATVIPPAHEADFVEKIIRLPDSYLPNSQRPSLSAPPSRAVCGLPEKGIVFCCFNNSFKITPDAFSLWMRLLLHVEGSVLWLREGSAGMRANLLREAKMRGIASDRLVFAPQTPKIEDHFDRQQLADIFLDTFYYNAHTTASDALWAGVPLVTCEGPAFAGRVGASLLRAVGLPELIAASLAQYEELALRLAREENFLASTKRKLAEARAHAPLFDSTRITRHLEQGYRFMWQRAENGQAPQSFNLPRQYG
jgi:predicted O-linked N-acetylglucosamine transferase (SPINDLY family)